MRDVKFRPSSLREGWYLGQLMINYLRFQECSFSSIEDKAFKIDPLFSLTSLSFIDSRKFIFDIDAFSKFNNLQNLTFDRTRISLFGRPHFIKAFKDTLHLLELISMYEETTLSVLFQKYVMRELRVLRIISTINRLDDLNASNFTVLPNLNTLELRQCKLRAIADNTFDELHRTLQYLDLRDNHLTSLPINIFNKIIYNILGIHLDDNPWVCHENLTAVSLKLKKMDILFDITTCTDKPNIPTIKPTTIDQTTYRTTITLDKQKCVRDLLPKRAKFSIRYNDRFKTICIESFQSAPSEHFNMIVLFFSHCVTNQTFETCRQRKTKWCSKIKTSTGSIISIPLPQAQNRVVHSVCVIREYSKDLHPLHCLSFTPEKKLNSYEDIWITYDTKYWVLSTITFIYTFIMLIGIFIIYIACKMNPKLLKGNRRVIIVADKNPNDMRKPSSPTVMIMPKEWSSRYVFVVFCLFS